MYKTSNDRRFKKNKKEIRRAFIDLVIEKGYDKLTISEITERADINRMTFYSHYAYKLGRRAALLSGLLLASAQVLFIMQMPQAEMDEFVNQVSAALPMGASGREEVEGMMDKLPVITFIGQWIYCYLYGTILASVMSRYIFLQKLFGGNFPPRDHDAPDEQ